MHLLANFVYGHKLNALVFLLKQPAVASVAAPATFGTQPSTQVTKCCFVFFDPCSSIACAVNSLPSFLFQQPAVASVGAPATFETQPSTQVKKNGCFVFFGPLFVNCVCRKAV